jgi:hypothetical protein
MKLARPKHRIVVFERKDGLWDWHSISPRNRKVRFGSVQGQRKQDALRAARDVARDLSEGATVELRIEYA